MSIIYLGLGSNQGDRVGYIQQAISLLKDQTGLRLLSASSFYETEPVGDPDQEWYINAVVAMETRLPPEMLLAICQSIERQLGRRRSAQRRWGPRTIDIDILFYETLVLNTPELTLPHPRVHERACMLVPLLEINPRLVHPVLRKSVEALHNDLPAPEEVLLYGTRPQSGRRYH